MNKIGSIENTNILFLQGPIGPFFKQLDLNFRKKGANTFKITLNASDWFFSNYDNTYPFKGSQDEWTSFVRTFLEDKKIDKIFLSGDCRFYQRTMISVGKSLGIDIFVFEEGYVRPDFITMECYGVNDFSHISKDANFYKALDDSYLVSDKILPAKQKYWRMAFSAIAYYSISHACSLCYPKYIHHREPSAIKEFLWWWRNVYRKVKYKMTERGITDTLREELSKKYYFVPLQTYNDFQLIEHSNYTSIEAFIEEVIDSFGRHAPKETLLIFKHHPADRGRKDYKDFIEKLARELAIFERVIIIYDLHLPTCLKNALGTVTINSTVGLSSLYHKIPTITLGRAIYDLEGLTSQHVSLDDFWEDLHVPDTILFKKFRNYLIRNTQLNGSFYGLMPHELK